VMPKQKEIDLVFEMEAMATDTTRRSPKIAYFPITSSETCNCSFCIFCLLLIEAVVDTKHHIYFRITAH